MPNINKSVVYQEVPNNFTDSRQSISGVQIQSIKIFNGAHPTGNFDFIGQMALCHSVDGKINVYIGTPYSVSLTGWQLVGSSEEALPDNVVTDNVTNDFKVYDQTILGSQIASMKQGVGAPATVRPEGLGELYIDVQNSEFPEVYLSFEKAPLQYRWHKLSSKEGTELPETVVKTDQVNNFTAVGQTIGNQPIGTVVRGSFNPVDTNYTPERMGEIFWQPKEFTGGSSGAKLWVAKSTNAASGDNWEELVGDTSLYTKTSKPNNFTDTAQTLKGKQILSYIDGGDKNPGESKTPADHQGQIYIAHKRLASGVVDLATWMAVGNQWLPLQKESGGIVDDSNYAKLDQTNVFSDPIQFLGNLAEGRYVSGVRIKRDRAPIADPSWKAIMEGEVTIYINSTTSPKQYSIWMAVKADPTSATNAGEWVKIYSSTDKIVDMTDLAKLSQPNTFCPLQKIGVENNTMLITGGRRGTGSPTANRLLPYAPGEIYVEYVPKPSGGFSRRVWMAGEESDIDSWIPIIIGEEFEEQNAANKVLFDFLKGAVGELDDESHVFQNFIVSTNQRLEITETDLDGLGTTVGTLDSEMTALDTKVNRLNLKIEEVNDHVFELTTGIETMNTTVTTIATELDSLEVVHGSLEDKVVIVDTRLGGAEVKIADLLARVAALEVV